MSLQTIRRLAADILGTGQGRVRFKSDALGSIQDALTRNDVRDRIKDGSVYALPVRGRRKRKKHSRQKAGRRKGFPARLGKESWMVRVRSQRKYLRQLISEGQLDHASKKTVYAKIKSGIFRSKAAMHLYLEENHLLKRTTQKEAVSHEPGAMSHERAGPMPKAQGPKQP